ncbi:MAG: rod shape-determining protein MreD [Longimicrobiales bacterium]
MARSKSGFSIFVAVLILVHLLLHVGLGIGESAPDLMTVAVLLAARRMRATTAAILGLLLGVLEDSLALVSFGASAVAFSFIAVVGARSRDLFEGDSLLFVAVYLFLGKVLRDGIHVLLTAAESDMLMSSTPLAALYATVSGLIALGVYRAISGEH